MSSDADLRAEVATCREILGVKHPTTLKLINNMAMLLHDQGKLVEAEPLHREALAGWREVLGDKHPVTLRSINNLALLLGDQGKLAEAEPLLREALAAHRETQGDKHPRLSPSTTWLHCLGPGQAG